MAPRYRPKRRCRNCPETEEGLPVGVASPVQQVVTYEGEGAGLWKAASVACGTILELMFRYITLSVPGSPLPQLERLRTRLDEIIEIRKQQEEEIDDAFLSPPDPILPLRVNAGWIVREDRRRQLHPLLLR